jgi:hypothetical protein
MADLKVLVVADGARFTFGPRQSTSQANADYFGVSDFVAALRGSTAPTIQVDTAHRRGATFAGSTDVDTSLGLTFPGDFVFTSIDLSTYDVLWLFGDEGLNGGSPGSSHDAEISDDEKIAIATFMDSGGGLFAVGDHDGIGAHMCGGLPRVRTMRRWFEWDHPMSDPASGQSFETNWSAIGLSSNPNQKDRNDTLQPDAADGKWYFNDQSDAIPQPLLRSDGTPITASPDVHPILRGAEGAIIAMFPDHMHEGEATDLTTIGAGGVAFSPDDASHNPIKVTFHGSGGVAQFVEYPTVGGFRPQPGVIAWGHDSGHPTQLGAELFPTTNPKTRGILSVYDGHGAGVGRVLTGSTFHHYLDKNLVGDPQTQSSTPGQGPTGSDTGFQAAPAILDPIHDFYVNAVTWLARPNRNFYFWIDKNSFGRDEMADAVANGQTFDNAFFVVLDGFAPNALGNLASLSVTLSGPFTGAGTSFIPGVPQPTDAGHLDQPQRILFPFGVRSIPDAAFPSAGTGPKELLLVAELSAAGRFFAAEAEFQLVSGADPYFTNIDAGAKNVFYLSQDLRVFTVSPTSAPAPMVPFPATNPFTFDANAAFTYLQALLAHLNDPSSNFTTPNGADPFVQLAPSGDLNTDTSITPFTFTPFPLPHANYSFAIARVRLRGSPGSSAPNVKVFFRMFATQTSDTDYQPDTTYPSVADARGLPGTPLTGTGFSTMPFFATPGGSQDYDTGIMANERTIPIVDPSGAWAYFGCYLNVYDGSVSPHLPGSHHCLVAQIAYDDAPIVNANGVTMSPENSDKLAQRNLQITGSGNPGGPAAHRIPQTFDARPSARFGDMDGSIPTQPDELVIDWGRTPPGSVVSIYWPQVDAIDVVRLATRLYSNHGLSVADRNTIRCAVGGRYTFVPVPFSTGAGFAGLFTIDLPLTVVRGQIELGVAPRATGRARPAAAQRLNADWRYVTGTFRIHIPVGLEEDLLRPEMDALAILKWRLGQTPPSDRWHPVLLRYVAYVAGRVEGFGGEPSTIPPSQYGAPPPRASDCCAETIEIRGRICRVSYDCHGDVESFELESCCRRQVFRCAERGIGELARRLCSEGAKVCIAVDRAKPERICRIVVVC